MFRLISLLLVMILGLNNNGPKHDLRKKPTHYNYNRRVDSWVERNRIYIIGVLAAIGFILFIIICVSIVGASATESGVVYNHFQDVI